MQIESAYKILDDLEEMNLKPNVGIYNAMMAECFREVYHGYIGDSCNYLKS